MRKGDASKVINLISQGHIDWLYELYLSGTPMSEKDLQTLKTHGMISPKMEKAPKKYSTKHHAGGDNKSYTQNEADKYVDVIVDDGNLPEDYIGPQRHIFLDNETYDKIAETHLFHYSGGKEITVEDWKPKSVIYHTKEFVNWINSINSGFQNMIKYKKFAMYCQQSEDWMNDNITIDSFATDEEKFEYLQNEILRCQSSSLYFLDKYLEYAEPSAKDGTGTRKYIARPVHKFLAFMIDSGYSFMAGKPRQIAATTTIGGIAVGKMIFNKNFFIKMIAQDKDKVMEIFEDKIKFAFGALPDWMRPAVANDTNNYLRLAKKLEKGKKGGVNSKLRVVAPTVSAINGGAPPLVLIDEAGYIGILGKMMKQARPTMFVMDEDTKKLEVARQIVVWGTGGEMDKGGKAYEDEFYDAKKKWDEGHFSNGIIPIFLDWTTRPGITRDYYNKEKQVYTITGPEKEARAVEFKQTYPATLQDMFLTSHKLLVGPDWINEQFERIKKASIDFRPILGTMEPIYDYNVPADDNSDTPWKIIGANFIPLDEVKDDLKNASVMILSHPKKNWKNRYYKGTDPISTDNGHSNMSSSIYDAHYNCPVAVLNYRSPNHKETFLQCFLLGLYYDTRDLGDKQGVPELVESNIGQGYIDYVESKGYTRSLVYNKELPMPLQGGQALIGIDNRSNRSKMIIIKMHELIVTYGEKIFFRVYYEQLMTFVCKLTATGETWEPADKKKHHDDVLFGGAFSYICAGIYAHKTPVNTTTVAQRTAKKKKKLIWDSEGNLVYSDVQTVNF